MRRKRAEAAEQERQRRAEEEERERREQAEAAERERRERAEQYTNQGRVYAAKGNYDQARKCLHKALGLGYGRGTVEALLAELRQERERRERAEAAERERQRKGVLARLWNALRGRN